MSDKTPGSRGTPTFDSSAGTPANQSVQQQPSDEELDRRDREKARPRRAAGPPLRDDGAEAARDAPAHEPPPATDPMSGPTAGGPSERRQEARGGATQASDAGRPADYAAPKPSADELDRRDRLKAGPRRAAGPPLRDDGAEAARDAPIHEPPPATDPE